MQNETTTQENRDQRLGLHRPIARLRRRIVLLSGVRPGDHVVDIGTGAGAQAFAFAAAGAKVTGVDMDPAALAAASRRNRDANVTFVDANATELPFADSTFDVACICFALHEMPPATRYEVIAEMARVTRPGGRIVIVDQVLPSNAVLAAWIDRVVGLFERDHRVGFVHSDLCALVAAAGVTVHHDEGALMGAVRILIGS